MRRRRLLTQGLTAPWWLQGLAAGGLAAGSAAAPAQAPSPAVELITLALQRGNGMLTLDFAARLRLSRPIEDALQRGLPLYFVAQAALYQRRWYWRDRRLARVRRRWRLAFQPLTATWRVGLGALTQTYDTLPEALSALSAAGGWPLAELSALDRSASHYVEFSYGLDTTQLPSPMQISVGGQADWVLRIERTLPLS